MRTSVLLPAAAVALATAAVATWGPGLARQRAAAPDHRPSSAASSRHAAAKAPLTSRSLVSARYRAEVCSGDYVCGEEGPWEPVAAASPEIRPLTSDGF